MVCYPGPTDLSVAEHKTGETPTVTDRAQTPADAQRNHIKPLLCRDEANVLGTSQVLDIHKLRLVRERKYLPSVQAVDNPVTAIEPTP